MNTPLEIDPGTPVVATSTASKPIKTWTHFKAVFDAPVFSSQRSNLRENSIAALPWWLGISKMITKSDALYYHAALLITFDCQPTHLGKNVDGERSTECLIYTPHGIKAEDLESLPLAKPSLKVLALLHGLHEIKISLKQLNLGAHNALRAQRICQARYWISTRK